MSERTRVALAVLGAALVLGVLGDLLLRVGPWGLNLPVWVAAVVAGVGALAVGLRLKLPGGGRWLLLPAVLFAAGVAWRDSPFLLALDVLALLVCLALAAWRSQEGSVRLASFTDYLLGCGVAWAHAAAGTPLLVFADVGWGEIPRAAWSGRAAAVARGIALAFPLVLLFGALLASADAVFQRMVWHLFDWDFETVFTHLLLAGFCAWVVGGFLRATLINNLPLPGRQRPSAPPNGSPGERPPLFSLGITELGITLGLLDALFLLFVFIQLRYLFGGTALVQATTGLTWAEYARRGFFELVAVAALSLPLLLGADALLRRDNRSHAHLFRLLAGTFVLLLFVVLASAAQRMRLYQEAFGLTELRLYVIAFIGWLAVVFAWFMATVLRGRRDRFAFGALVSGCLAIGLLNAVNPDGLIVRTNAGRVDLRHRLDTEYVTSLSADAVPDAVAALPSLQPDERRDLAASLLAQWSPPTARDWRTWNWSRARAWEAVQANQPALRRMAGSKR